MYDVAVIGAGVTGCAIARELSRYKARLCVLERGEDVCTGTSKANSAIVHGGFDAANGTLKAEMNVRGSAMMTQVAEELDVPFKRNGALVLCFDEGERPGLQALYERGVQNGVEGLQILTGEEARAMEPNLSDAVCAALYCPSSGIICPFELTLGFAENAAVNGAEFRFESGVTAIRRGVVRLNELTAAERAEKIRENPLYGSIVCRCETVSEGEIVDAVRRPLGATTLDGVKRRTRAGMGRCQAGFCSPRVMDILARELGVPVTAVRKNGKGSEIVCGKTEKGGAVQ